MRTLYSALNQDAKAWWFNRQLREQGDNLKARQREREQIKRRVADLRLARQVGAYAVIGNYYPSLEYAEHRTGEYSTRRLSIQGIDRDLLRVMAKVVNIPVIDLQGASGRCYNELMNITPDLSNLQDVMKKIELLKKSA